MKTRRSAIKTPKILCIDEIPYTDNCIYFGFLARLIYSHYKTKYKNKTLGKKG